MRLCGKSFNITLPFNELKIAKYLKFVNRNVTLKLLFRNSTSKKQQQREEEALQRGRKWLEEELCRRDKVQQQLHLEIEQKQKASKKEG